MENHKCLNCGLIVSKPENSLLNSSKTNEINSNERLLEIFKTAIKENTLTNGELCHRCNLVIHMLHSARKDFILRTKGSSLVGRKIIANKINIQMSNINKPKSGDIFPTIEEEVENILPFGHSLSDEENEAVRKTNYVEKHLLIKIPKLMINFQQRKSPDLVPTKSCDACGRHFDSTTLLDEHFNSVHSVIEKRWPCQPCNVEFSIEWFYRNHLKTFHREIEIKFSCFLCDEKYNSQEEVDNHKLKAHRITSHPFKCNYCDVAFVTPKEIPKLRDHLIKHHSDSPEAKAAVFNNAQIRRGKSRRTIFKCLFCSENNLKGYSMLSLHILCAHFGHKVCLVCQMEFNGIEDFKEHVLKFDHYQKQCTKCQKDFNIYSDLIKHFNAVHNPSRSYPFVCEVCGTRFFNSEQLVSHYKWHERVAGPRQFNCTRCPKTFTLKHHLQLHMKYHQKKDSTINSDNRTTEIKHLPKSADSKKDLNEAQECDDCGRIFKNLKALCRHRRAHVNNGLTNSTVSNNGNKPKMSTEESKYIIPNSEGKFACSLCELVYARLDGCIRHLFQKHNIKLRDHKSIVPVKCPICGKMVRLKARLTTHLKTHENDGKSKKNDGLPRSDLMKLECPLCKLVVLGVGKLRNHFQSEHPNSKEAKIARFNIDLGKIRPKESKLSFTNDRNKCQMCDILFPTIIERDQHVEKLHGQKIQCVVCQREFTEEVQCRNHENIHKYISCSVCSEVLTTVQDYHSHFEKRHLELPFICEICGKTSLGTKRLRVHYYFHRRESFLLKCQVCRRKFSKESSFRKHQSGKNCKRIKKRGSERKNYRCNICKASFASSTKFADHMESFHKILANVKCKICDKLFFHLHSLKCHMNLAHKQKLQPKETSNSNEDELTGGKVSNVSGQNYNCPKCNLGFAAVENYNYHLTYHHLGKKSLQKKCQKKNANDLHADHQGKSQRLKKSKTKTYIETSSETDESEGSESWITD